MDQALLDLARAVAASALGGSSAIAAMERLQATGSLG
jgi:hypothetical protein